MSDGGGSVDDYDVNDREDEINSDNLSNQESDSPTESDPEEDLLEDEDDNDDDNEESEQPPHKSTIIEEPLFT